MGKTQETMMATAKQVEHTGNNSLKALTKVRQETSLAWNNWNDALHNKNNLVGTAKTAYETKNKALGAQIQVMQKSVTALTGEIKDLVSFANDKKNRLLPMFTATGLPALKKYLKSADVVRQTWEHEVAEAKKDWTKPAPRGEGH